MTQVDNFVGKLSFDSIARQHTRLDITSYAVTIDAIDANIGVDATAAHSSCCKTSSLNVA